MDLGEAMEQDDLEPTSPSKNGVCSRVYSITLKIFAGASEIPVLRSTNLDSGPSSPICASLTLVTMADAVK